MNSSTLSIGRRVRVEGVYLDEACTCPLTGAIKDIFARPDWGEDAFVVMFDIRDPMLPPGGEFPACRLEPLGACAA